MPTELKILTLDKLSTLLPKRSPTSHKGDFGHVLIVGGDYGMAGAVRMAGEAALRVGAGLVSVATRPEHLAIVNSMRPELMCHGVKNSEDLQKLIPKATVLVIGPGLGQSEWSQNLFHSLLTINLPKIVDADALNLLSQQPQKNPNWILTPHAGEAARLLNVSIENLQADRSQSIQKLQAQYDGVIVLKGAGTLVLGPSKTTSICKAGNPGMAVGGMGDVLSGVLGGLVAQGLTLETAAELGVCLHATAGDLAAADGGERGLLASDLMPYLRRLVN